MTHRPSPIARPLAPIHTGPLTPSQRVAQFLRVEPAAAATGGHSRSLVARVTFDERHYAALGAPVQGRVASVGVVVGDHVTQGQILLVIHAPDIAAANAQVSNAHAAAILAESNATRARTLVAQGAGSVADQQTADEALVQARSEETRALAARDALGGAHGLSDYELHAPIAGEVVERNVSVGTEVHVGQDQPLITVADLSDVWVEGEVYEQDLPLIHLNDPATVDVVAYPGRNFPGTITYVGETLDPTTRTARARIQIDNHDGALRPGMFAHVLVRGQALGEVEVPVSAVLARRDQYFVFVQNADNTYAMREVERGNQIGEHVTILSGLRPGERVVTEGAILLDAEANSAL